MCRLRKHALMCTYSFIPVGPVQYSLKRAMLLSIASTLRWLGRAIGVERTSDADT